VTFGDLFAGIGGSFWIYHEGRVRKLTINECYRIMGFPDEFILTGAKSELYRQIGNSVCIPMIRGIGRQLIAQLLTNDRSVEYYLRLLDNPSDFVDEYVTGLEEDKALKFEHKKRWNELVSGSTL